MKWMKKLLAIVGPGGGVNEGDEYGRIRAGRWSEVAGQQLASQKRVQGVRKLGPGGESGAKRQAKKKRRGGDEVEGEGCSH